MMTDCLIIGSGVAGLTSAITLAQEGREVTVITAANSLEETNTSYAQGGIIFESIGRDRDLLSQDIM